MNESDRQVVVDTARYLRNVRPIDPEEIYQYVAGEPHPAVVRQVLRDHQVDLSLLERDDGTFVPVPDEPLSVSLPGVDRLPAAHVDTLEDVLTDRFGVDWYRGESGDDLRERIRQFKRDYFDHGATEYDAETVLAYAVYHLPAYYAVAQHTLVELAGDGLLSRELRVLDVGAGVGGPALGILDALPEDTLVDYHALEPSPAADVFDRLVEPGRNRHVTVYRERAETFETEGEYDLLVFANVLSELDDPVGVVERYLDTLSADGTCLLLAPADLNTATGLRQVERTVCDDHQRATVYAPTVRLWPGERPTDRGWSFTRKPDIEVPRFQRALDDAGGSTGEFRNTDVQYAYAVLRQDGRTRYGVRLDADRYARMADAESHVTDRVDLLAAKLSHDLGERNPLYKVSDGSEAVDHYAVRTRVTELNADLERAPYGAILAFENVLVLWNADEESYNLVVDESAVVDVVG